MSTVYYILHVIENGEITWKRFIFNKENNLEKVKIHVARAIFWLPVFFGWEPRGDHKSHVDYFRIEIGCLEKKIFVSPPSRRPAMFIV